MTDTRARILKLAAQHSKGLILSEELWQETVEVMAEFFGIPKVDDLGYPYDLGYGFDLVTANYLPGGERAA